MTTHFQHDCPHCKTKGAGFSSVFQWPVRGQPERANSLAICGVCNEGITLRSVSLRTTPHPSLTQYALQFPGIGFTIEEFWPGYRPDMPSNIPENVSRFYSQGLENLHAHRWDAAGAMFRKTLDTGTKALAPELKSLSLYKRINKLVEMKVLTEAMGSWSHRIRLDSNDAVHDEEPETAEDAKLTKLFTEAFLTYAFTLPALVSTGQTTSDSTPARP